MSVFRHAMQILTNRSAPRTVFRQIGHMTESSYEEVRIPVPWGHIAGKWWGPQDRRPILCVHGWKESGGTFDRLILQLQPQLRDTGLLAIDLPGQGYSSRLPQGMFYHEVSGPILVRRIQKYFDWPTVSFLAHSMGACTTFLFSSLFPDKVDLSIEIDGLKPFSQTPGSAIETVANNIENFLRYDEQNDANSPAYTYAEITQKLFESYIMQSSLAEHNAKYVLDRSIGKAKRDPSKYSFLQDSRLKCRTLVGMQHDDVCAYATRIRCPLLKIKASKGPYYENRKYIDDVNEILKTNNKHFELVNVEGTHHVHINEPKKIADILIPFLIKHNHVDRSIGGLNKEIITSKLL